MRSQIYKEVANLSRKGRASPSRNPRVSIPSFSLVEKITETVPVKLQPSLKKCLIEVAGKRKVSTWVRKAIIERLEKEKTRLEIEGLIEKYEY